MLPKTIHKEYISKIIQYLLDEVDNSKTNFQKKISFRNITIICLLFSTGVRISELCNIKLKDINLQEKSLKIVGKGSKERILYVGNTDVIELCKTYIQLYRENIDCEYLF